jgi:hypothetical protein
MIQLIGTLTSLGWFMIGRWISSPLSSMFYAPLEWVGRVMIAYVECAKKDLLKSELFIRVHLLNGVFPFPWKSIWSTKALLKAGFLYVDNFPWEKFHFG